MSKLDLDTRQRGTEAPFEAWEGDLTAFVHVLWDARRQGFTLADNADEIASMLLRSRAMAARTAMAVDKHRSAHGGATLLSEAERLDCEAERLDCEADEWEKLADEARADYAKGEHSPSEEDGMRVRAQRYDRRARDFRERANTLRAQAG